MKKQRTLNLTKNLKKKMIKGRSLSNPLADQPTKFYPIVVLADEEEIIVSTSGFNLTIQCAPETCTKKGLFKNLIKSPV